MIITSKDKIPVEQDFKVEAGPGAGKTEFLANHIKNVIQNSTRLFRVRKVACITYTNTTVETIIDYRYANYDVEKVDKYYTSMSDMLAKAQTSLYIINSSMKFEGGI